MPAFKFSLQPVLDHRMTLEEQAQKEVARVQLKLDECQGSLERLETKQDETRNDMYARLAGGMVDAERAIYANYLTALEQKIGELRKEEREILAELEKVRKALIEAMKNREIIEEAKKAEYREYQKQERREEAKMFDELGQRAWRLNHEENLSVLEEAKNQ